MKAKVGAGGKAFQPKGLIIRGFGIARLHIGDG
jgi:hypothetical protein